MISNFIITFLCTAAVVVLLTIFITLGENIDWFFVRCAITLIGLWAGFLGALACNVACVSLSDLIKNKLKGK